MSRIVKSISVVDDRQHRDDRAKSLMEAAFVSKKVLKGGVLDSYGFSFHQQGAPVTRDAALEELNRLRVQVEEAKTELQELRQQIAEEQEEHERRRSSMENADILDDQVYQARVQEIRGLMADLQTQSDQILGEAQERAKDIGERAQADGHQQGYNNGYQAAEQAFQEEAAPKQQELAQLITDLSSYGEELMREKENEFIQLAVAVAEKILAREIKTDRTYIMDMLSDLLSRNHRETYINISISPDMLPEQAKACDEILEQLRARAQNLSIYVEREAEPGTLLVETPKGVTDMSLPTQLDNMKEALLEEQAADAAAQT